MAHSGLEMRFDPVQSRASTAQVPGGLGRRSFPVNEFDLGI
jgi:hypothetical protein